LHAGPNTIAAGLLHDVVEDIETVSEKDIIQLFGKDVASLVMSVTKVSESESESYSDSKNKTIQKVFHAMSSDVRTIIIKLADRLNNMRTLGVMKEEKKKRISSQTLELYAPVARYIGLNKIAAELEELCLYYLNNDIYSQILYYVKDHNVRYKESLDIMCKNIKQALQAMGIECDIYRTNKEIYKIYKFISDGKHTLDEIDDLDVIHVLVEKNLECYLSLGIIHSIYTPLMGRLKDYITSPKFNMYQAIHTIVISPIGNPSKIAISTKVMDNLFNFGIADKWKYDESNGYDQNKEQEDIRNHLNIIRELDRINSDDKVNPSEYVRLLQEDIFNHNQYIYVYNTVGEVIVLPIGSTVLDFAFKISDKIGIGLKEAYINGIPASFDSKLKNGSIISVKSDNKCYVKPIWKEWVVSNYARLKIEDILKK
jgi:GTP pyrophosphokinase